MLNNTLEETVKIAYVEDEPSIAQPAGEWSGVVWH